MGKKSLISTISKNSNDKTKSSSDTISSTHSKESSDTKSSNTTQSSSYLTSYLVGHRKKQIHYSTDYMVDYLKNSDKIIKSSKSSNPTISSESLISTQTESFYPYDNIKRKEKKNKNMPKNIKFNIGDNVRIKINF